MNNYNFKTLFLAVVIFNCLTLNVSAFYIYNAGKNKCLRASGPGSSLTYGICDESAEWDASNYYNYPVQYRSIAYPDYCISVENENVTIKECDDNTTLHLKGNQLFQPNSDDNCIGSSESNPNEITLKQCDRGDSDQIWFFNDFEPVEVYLYNAAYNKCLRTNGQPQSPISYGACDNSDNTVWTIPYTHEGYYRSKVNPDFCLSIDNGNISLKECSENTIIIRDGNFIKSPSSENYCISLYLSGVSLDKCDVNDLKQVWYFNNYDPSLVIEDTTATETVTVYLYNANNDKCLNNNDSSVVYGRCNFNNDDSLWEIPPSHYGYYRSKADPEKCLSITNDGTITLSECSENTVFTRDGNFIKSILSNDFCVGSSENNSAILKECDLNANDQIWYFNNFDPSILDEPVQTVTVYFYNVFRDGCINNDGTSVTIGNCNLANDESLWEIPTSHDGYYRSKINPEKCLNIVDGTITLSDCSGDNKLYRDGNFIKSPLSDNHCIVPSRSDVNLEYSENCNVNDIYDLWFFNLYEN